MMEMILCAGAAVGVIGTAVAVPELLFRRKIGKEKENAYIKPPIEDIFMILEKMHHEKYKWKRSSQTEHQYECEVESYRILITAHPEQNCIKLSIQEKGILWYEICVQENHVIDVYVKEREENGTFLEEQRTIHLYGMWILGVKKRLEEEEGRRKKEMERLQLDWGKRKKEQEEAFEDILHKLSYLTILEMKEDDITSIGVQNNHFMVNMERIEDSKIGYTLTFQNGLVLFKGKLNIRYGVIKEEKRLPYIHGERKEKLFSVFHQHIELCTKKKNDLLETGQKVPVTKTVLCDKEVGKKVETLRSLIETLRLEKEWLSEEEVFWLEKTVETDIQATISVYETVSENKKDEAKELCIQTIRAIEEKVELYLHRIDKRKIQELQKRLRIVEERGAYYD